jgi:hypothetical protein
MEEAAANISLDISPICVPPSFGPLCMMTGRLFWLLFVTQSWARNKFTIESIFPRQVAGYMYKTVIMMQLWQPHIKAAKEGLMVDLLVLALQQVYNRS